MHSPNWYSNFNSMLAAARRQALEGVYDAHTNIMCYPKTMQPTHARWEEVPPSDSDVPPIVSRNYLVVDTHYESPPISGLGIPGPDGDFYDVGVNGLPDLDEEDLATLTPECRVAFEKAKVEEHEWKNQWHSESVDGARAKLRIGFSGVPV